MHWTDALLVMVAGVCALLALGTPVAFAFLGVNIVCAIIFLGGEAGIVQLVGNMVNSVTSFAFTPIPMFLLMGDILFHTGLAIKAIDAVSLIIRRVPARLSVVALVAGTIFSAVSGSTIATTAMLGALLLPEMLRRGYDRKLAMGPIMAIGGVDMLIPPSSLAVLLGGLSSISISGLLIGGLIPGLLLSVIFIGYIVLVAWLRPSLAPTTDIPNAEGWQRWRPFVVHVLPLAIIIGAVIGSMIFGVATPTESAAVGAAASIVYAAAFRALTWGALRKAVLSTTAVTGMILFIILGAAAFSQILAFSGATTGLIAAVTDSGLSATAILVGMLALLIILGLFIDQASIMMLTVPLFMPFVKKFGFDEVWFGVMYLVCMQLGLLTPPFGLLLFTMKGVAPPDITMEEVIRAAFPYVIFGLVMLTLIFFIPGIATWLPSVVSP
jgi:tripartite ATP-independent transporter DctM subunit